MLRIRVNNFQRLADIDIQAEGLTVITGPNNIGKSALVRACEAALFGKPGDYYIRSGEHTAHVRLDEDDPAHPWSVHWLKTTKPTTTRQTHLVVDGTLHSKLGREHAKLTVDLGFRTLDTQYNAFRPQFAAQGSKPFLLQESETEIAELMKLVASADIPAKATDLARRDRRDNDALLKTRLIDLTTAEAEIKHQLDLVENLAFEDPDTEIIELDLDA